MYKYALMINNKVAGYQETSEAVDDDSLILIEDGEPLPLVGSAHQNGKFTQPVKAVSVIRHISKGAFLGRLTVAENIAYEQAVDSDIQVRVFDKRFQARSFVDLDFEELHQGLDYLVGQGIITDETKAKLLKDGTQEEAA